jgi:hypothetical protein
MKHKTLDFQVLEKADNGGRILISNASFDRDADRVFPLGAQIDSYLKNPVVQWGHGYDSPWQTVGRTTGLEITPDGIVASFELRPAANDQDPQNIVKLLWDGGWIRTASIGFIPKAAQPNQSGGNDFTQWELLEWSLVPIPANSEALRMSIKALDTQAEPMPAITKGIEQIELKRGRVLSSANEGKLRGAYDAIGAVLAQIAQEPEQNAPQQEPEAKSEPDDQTAVAAELGEMLKAVKQMYSVR